MEKKDNLTMPKRHLIILNNDSDQKTLKNTLRKLGINEYIR